MTLWVPPFNYGRPGREVPPEEVKLLPFSFRVIRLDVIEGDDQNFVKIWAEVQGVNGGGVTVIRSEKVGGRQAPIGDLVRYALQGMLNHEIDECLMVNGKHLREPHPEIVKVQGT